MEGRLEPGSGSEAWPQRCSWPPTLPEGEEDDCLDGEELQDWLEGLQEVSGGKVEEEERVEGQADGGVVDQGHIQVAAVDTGREICCQGGLGGAVTAPCLPPEQWGLWGYLSMCVGVGQPPSADKNDPTALSENHLHNLIDQPQPEGRGPYVVNTGECGCMWLCICDSSMCPCVKIHM